MAEDGIFLEWRVRLARVYCEICGVCGSGDDGYRAGGDIGMGGSFLTVVGDFL